MEREGGKEGGVLENEERESWRKGSGEEGREGEEMSDDGTETGKGGEGIGGRERRRGGWSERACESD